MDYDTFIADSVEDAKKQVEGMLSILLSRIGIKEMMENHFLKFLRW